ncbi:hypothetical protein [Streptomyces sp. NPDC048637]|uniref:hypothetical protein n=1 Tax=Streptomyces sp. NPDC048637 TaxID=3155636 RepID=UPI0034360EE1
METNEAVGLSNPESMESGLALKDSSSNWDTRWAMIAHGKGNFRVENQDNPAMAMEVHIKRAVTHEGKPHEYVFQDRSGTEVNGRCLDKDGGPAFRACVDGSASQKWVFSHESTGANNASVIEKFLADHGS